ncbi:Inner membrane protein YedI [bioreactor metagenome]|uniref:Inner membrane protein YedI n=1 Tax=bioreactor metagenome TaxID=1076179 RepID=A0A645DI02_9ZZZZ
MASGFFAVLDDIAALMDDIAVTSKVATKQTAGILGDDLAVNAEKATGFLSSREIPVLMAIMKGSFINKLIILPIAFLLQWLYPPAIKVILVFGGLYLAYEGTEKIIEYFFHKKKDEESTPKDLPKIEKSGTADEDEEKSKIKSAIMTDFILSIEIVIIALGSVLNKSLGIQIITVSIVAVIATVGVYGIVAMIVRMDDAGYGLIRKSKNRGIIASLGKLLIKALPVVIKALGIIGTIALILVAGGIFDHNIAFIHELLPNFPSMLKHALLGIAGGLVMVPVFFGIKKIAAALK